MPNQFLIIIDPQAGGRLQDIITESGYDEDDCGILDNVRCIRTKDALDTVMSRVSTAAGPQESLIVAPLAAPWAAQNAPAMEDCGRLNSLTKQRKRDEMTSY